MRQRNGCTPAPLLPEDGRDRLRLRRIQARMQNPGTTPTTPEPWLRGTLTDVPPVQRAVLHALEAAREDVERWCAPLTDAELQASPHGLTPVAFHLRHLAGSIDRLLTYAEGRQLSAEQLTALAAEKEVIARDELLTLVRRALEDASVRVRRFREEDFASPRAVGRKQLPTTVAGLLVHVADHTQRHVGQIVVTAKLVRATHAR